eukprot:3932066-Rhodomonas_salina.1
MTVPTLPRVTRWFYPEPDPMVRSTPSAPSIAITLPRVHRSVCCHRTTFGEHQVLQSLEYGMVLPSC